MRYPCDKCEYAATTLSNLKQLIENKHEGVRYLCDNCEFTASTVSNLRLHIELKHEEVRYPCDKCEYAANTTELRTFKWWISGLMLDPLFFLISRFKNACSPLVIYLQIN